VEEVFLEICIEISAILSKETHLFYSRRKNLGDYRAIEMNLGVLLRTAISKAKRIT